MGGEGWGCTNMEQAFTFARVGGGILCEPECYNRSMKK